MTAFTNHHNFHQPPASQEKITLGAVILAGGLSSRMGSNKAFMMLEGKTFLARTAEQLMDFDELLLSVDRAEPYSSLQGLRIIEDLYPERGPMGGLLSCLQCCRSDWLLAVSCDIPLFRLELAEYLAAFLTEEFDAIVPLTRDGGLHPLCALYSRRAATVFEKQLNQGSYSLVTALAEMPTKVIPLAHSAFPDGMLSNINTPQQYAKLCRQIYGPPVVAVCGVKNSGKTTLLENVLPILRSQGLAIAVIKHDGHDFDPDVPGTDSYRLRKAGAYAAAVYSPHRYMVTVPKSGATLEEMITQFPEADLILVEGGKQGPYPKIEVVRRAVSQAPAAAPPDAPPPAGRLAVVTDLNLQLPGGVPIIGLTDYQQVAALLTGYTKRRENHA